MCDDLYPPSETPYRFLNSGMWIADVQTARRALQAALAYGVKMQEDHYPLLGGAFPNTEWPVVPINRQNDQEMFSQVFLDGNLEQLQLDYRASLFQCMHMSWDDVQFAGALQRPTNILTGTQPVLYHFNGGSKHMLVPTETQLLGVDYRIAGDRTIEHERGVNRTTYAQLCAQYPTLWEAPEDSAEASVVETTRRETPASFPPPPSQPQRQPSQPHQQQPSQPQPPSAVLSYAEQLQRQAGGG